MKSFIFLMFLILSINLVSADRFYSDKEERDHLVIELLSSSSKNISEIEKRQEEMLDVLNSILKILEPFHVEEWDNVSQNLVNNG